MIVKADTSDTEKVITLIAALYAELGEEAESMKFLNKAFVSSVIESGFTEIYFIKEENKIAGIFTLTETHALYAGGKLVVIDELYILPEFRNKKLGEVCLNFIKLLSTERSWKRIELTGPADLSNDDAYRFYFNSAFEFTGKKLKFVL